MPTHEPRSLPEDREALEPATDEQKESILSAVSRMLSDREWQEWLFDSNEQWHGIDVALPAKRKASIFEHKDRKDGLAANVSVTEWLVQEYQPPVKIVNYQISKTPIDLQVLKKVSYYNNEIEAPSNYNVPPSLEQLEANLEVALQNEQTDKFEKDVGLQFFSRKDAIEVLHLLEEIETEKQKKTP